MARVCSGFSSYKPFVGSYLAAAGLYARLAEAALGMRRYEFAAEAAAVARDISRAASYFLLNQLPELYGGLQRDPTSFPVQYLGANVPQAWAAGTPFMLLQAMLGLQQDAPRGKLYVDPVLPDWLPDVTLTDLRLGRRRFDIRFWRDGKDTIFKVLIGKPDAVERMSIALSGSTPSLLSGPASFVHQEIALCAFSVAAASFPGRRPL
jgi:hypothetical protein